MSAGLDLDLFLLQKSRDDLEQPLVVHVNKKRVREPGPEHLACCIECWTVYLLVQIEPDKFVARCTGCERYADLVPTAASYIEWV